MFASVFSTLFAKEPVHGHLLLGVGTLGVCRGEVGMRQPLWREDMEYVACPLQQYYGRRLMGLLPSRGLLSTLSYL